MWLNTLEIHYIDSISLFLFFRHIKEVPILGFDCEWVSTNGKAEPIALIQLSSYRGECALIRVSHMPVLPQSLVVSLILSTPAETIVYYIVYRSIFLPAISKIVSKNEFQNEFQFYLIFSVFYFIFRNYCAIQIYLKSELPLGRTARN